MTLEAIALGDVHARRKDLQIRLDVKPGNIPASQRDYVIDVGANATSVQGGAFGVNPRNRRAFSPSGRSLNLIAFPVPAEREPSGMVNRTERGRFVVKAFRRIWLISQRKTPTPDGPAMILLAFSTSAHGAALAHIANECNLFREQIAA